ncbi:MULTISPECIES: FtsW/RodA/SpoVE family cell cycle protein [unclassified Saccharibacter]|uniref:FtsW/RodA/SpoVE family cell cycle protein n=1 Tax=unclassified Saccharibacter TaxID=2648722 RepID=UPI00132A4AB9|nr:MULTISPECIES: putative peptidoglycan glycosyltransferase FtsW [unclassified Saccharibacter]MXV35493.1 FtsW/RodA/SpoVE family cell cycle protein [Saccharibacter sp. EH611]MXV58153.1 FtsW/RodA/SpoVE family cell cycle protein [Saccharibacter sp. EH70]MXV65427.1 FtsW/RodA/SpoVE family cell cycle protein [Saccharibacter sp. EH60]
MASPRRTDTSSHAQWWRNIDHVALTGIGILMALGYILMLAASPAVAHRIGASRNVFIFKQVAFLSIAAVIVIVTSRLSIRAMQKLAVIGGVIALAATFMTLVHGMEIKGARRWIALPLMSVQPSEFLKPCFALLTGWLLSLRGKIRLRNGWRFPGRALSCFVFLMIVALLQAQPDIGMLSVITMVFVTQLFIDGLPIAFFVTLIAGMISAFGLAYLTFDHVRSRVQRFLHPDVGDHYQIDTSLRAFGNGGLLGRGPGEGRVKDLLPDAHADFVFAVAGEEYGFLMCLFIICVFVMLLLCTLRRLLHEKDPFVILAAGGLITGFGLQAFINMGSSLHLIPTKGMTLPFISYGGSSAFSIALTMGMVLALTKHRVQPGLFSPTPAPTDIPLSNRLFAPSSTDKD